MFCGKLADSFARQAQRGGGDDMSKGTWTALAVALLLLVVVGAWYWLSDRPVPEGGVAIESPPVEAAQPTPPPIEYPVLPEPTDASGDQAPQAPLPALDDSDAAMRGALEEVFGIPPIEAYLIPGRLIRHIVVTVDSLDREPVRLKQRPVAHVTGPITVDKVGDKLYLADGNAERYDAYVSAFEAVDAGRLVSAYLRYYPLFQRAYEELGYPQRYFNDRVVAVIDHLIAAPEVPRPIELLRPKVLYTYADPRLESMSWGRKILVRMGPEHAATVKRQLAEIRAEIVQRTGSSD
jgi:hypothetical protein